MSRNINICNVKMLSIFFTENLTQLPNCREVLDSLDKWKMNLQTHYAFALSNERLISHCDLIPKSGANFLASNCNVELKLSVIVKLFSFDKMINFTFSLRLSLVDLLTLYAPAYFFTNRVMYARQQMLQFCVCLFSFKERAWPGMSCDNLTA